MRDPEATLFFICAGSTYLDVRQSVFDMDVTDAVLARSGIRVLKLGMIHPLEPGIIDRFSTGLTEIVVVEEKKAFIELALKDLLYGRPDAPRVVGKRDDQRQDLLRADGDLPAAYHAIPRPPRLPSNTT